MESDWSNNPAYIECYSGGKLIYKAHTIGKVSSERGSDGYVFRVWNKKTKKPKIMEVSGECIIETLDLAETTQNKVDERTIENKRLLLKRSLPKSNPPDNSQQ